MQIQGQGIVHCYGTQRIKRQSFNICGLTQLNIHLEGVSDHKESKICFSGLTTFLKRRVDSSDTVQRHCW